MDHLSHAQVRSVLEIARAHSTRNYVALLLAYNHGLRISEVCKLTPENFSQFILSVQRLKGSLKTNQPLTDDEILDVSLWLAKCRAGQSIIGIKRSALSVWFTRYCRLAGIPQHLRHFHVLKHSCAMHIIPSGIEVCRQYLGHRSIASTGQYLRVDDATAAEKAQPLLHAR